MSAWDDFFNGLGDSEKEVAKKYATILANLSIERVKDIVEAIIDNKWQVAYELTASAMTTNELIAEIKALNESFGNMNESNASNITQVKAFLTEMLTVAVSLAASAV